MPGDVFGELYLRFMFDVIARRAGDHLHWGLWSGLPAGGEHFPAARERFAEHLLSHVPETVRSVIDVGCGLGGIAKSLGEQGRSVLAVSPRADHCALMSEAAFHNVEVRCESFETLAAEPADLLLFAESLNFFARDIGAMLDRCRAILRPV